MKNITFSAEERLIHRARKRAQQAGTTLNEVFREWLRAYAKQTTVAHQYPHLMRQLRYAQPGMSFSLDEVNAR